MVEQWERERNVTNGTKNYSPGSEVGPRPPQRTSDGLSFCVFTSKLTTAWLKEATLRGVSCLVRPSAPDPRQRGKATEGFG